MKHYVGIKADKRGTNCIREVFQAENPSKESHGDRFAYIIGPFVSEVGAKFMAGPGFLHPDCCTPNDAERMALLVAERAA
jgi:hypothetical protein